MKIMTHEYIADAEKKNRIFAERFASLRKSRGLTQRAIAEKLGITDRAVSKWETGRGTPKFSDTPILASIFGVTTDYLFGCEK
ncbi:MAG: helix-turn-helix transcriptional regulator [Synergistaceae bacterium]|nr:helix-turn-helix transcriptional regulator [Synergistaceae bacterium]